MSRTDTESLTLLENAARKINFEEEEHRFSLALDEIYHMAFLLRPLQPYVNLYFSTQIKKDSPLEATQLSEIVGRTVIFYQAFNDIMTMMFCAMNLQRLQFEREIDHEQQACFSRLRDRFFVAKRHVLPLTELNTLIENDPNLLHRRQQRAEVFTRRGHYEAALEDYNFILNKQPDAVHCRNTRATILENMGRFNEALDDYQEIILTLASWEIKHPSTLKTSVKFSEGLDIIAARGIERIRSQLNSHDETRVRTRLM